MNQKPPLPRAGNNRRMPQLHRGLDELCQAFRAEYGARAPLDYFTVMPQPPDAFLVLIAFKRDADVAASEAGGLADEMRAFVRARLAELGRTGEPEFDFNSLERIGREAGGYFRCLR